MGESKLIERVRLKYLEFRKKFAWNIFIVSGRYFFGYCKTAKSEIIFLSLDLRLVDGVAELLSCIHGQGSSALTEAYTLWPVASSVAGLAEELLLVLRARRRVQQLVAHG